MPASYRDFEPPWFLKDPDDDLKKFRQMSTTQSIEVIEKYEAFLLSTSDLLTRQNISTSALRHLRNKKGDLESRLSGIRTESENLQRETDEVRADAKHKEEEVHSLASELSQLRVNWTELSLDNKQKQVSFRHRLEAAKQGKLYYKDLLGWHISLIKSDDTVNEFLVTYNSFRPVSTDPLPDNSAKLQQGKKTLIWKLTATNPPLLLFKQVCKKLEESQDLQGLIEYLRPKSDIKHV